MQSLFNQFSKKQLEQINCTYDLIVWATGSKITVSAHNVNVFNYHWCKNEKIYSYLAAYSAVMY